MWCPVVHTATCFPTSASTSFAARLPDKYAPCTVDGKSVTVASPAKNSEGATGRASSSRSPLEPPTGTYEYAPHANWSAPQRDTLASSSAAPAAQGNIAASVSTEFSTICSSVFRSSAKRAVAHAKYATMTLEPVAGRKSTR